MAAVGQHRPLRQPLQPPQRVAHQRLARAPGDGRAGQGGGGGALRRAPAWIPGQQQLSGLAGQKHGQHLHLGFRGHRNDGPQRAREVHHPAVHHLAAPGETRPAAEHPAPFQGQPQGLARAVGAESAEVAQPAEAMQVLGEAPAGTGPVPGITVGQALAAEAEDAGHQPSTGLRPRRPKILGEDDEALGPGAGGQPRQMRRRAEPFGAALASQRHPRGFEPQPRRAESRPRGAPRHGSLQPPFRAAMLRA